MTDEQVMRFLMAVAGEVARLHRKTREDRPQTNAGPKAGGQDREVFDEGFSRWMGWRGQEAQEEEIRKNRKR